jgi:hypothetical protein
MLGCELPHHAVLHQHEVCKLHHPLENMGKLSLLDWVLLGFFVSHIPITILSVHA